MRKDPVESRVAILAADPPCNITHVHLPRAFPRRVPCCGFPFSMTEHVSRYRQEWFGGVRAARADILAGIVVALALIPEAIGFSIIAGVVPRVGLSIGRAAVRDRGCMDVEVSVGAGS